MGGRVVYRTALEMRSTGNRTVSSNLTPSATLRLSASGGRPPGVERRRVSPEAPSSERRETDPLWYVYFLRLSNDDIYVGSTNDLKRRFGSHQRGHVVSTRAHIPAKLISYVAVQSESIARELERYFKSGSGKAFANKRFLRSRT